MPPAPEEKKGKGKDSGAKKSRATRSTPRSEEDQAAGRAEWHVISEGNGRTLLSISLLAGRNQPSAPSALSPAPPYRRGLA